MESISWLLLRMFWAMQAEIGMAGLPGEGELHPVSPIKKTSSAKRLTRPAHPDTVKS
ncbi:hypothetical protein AA0311_2790 [Asaia bogorensis NBRC 16594]|nr:hypothetical protein Asbog_01075 [Asaia bogorensis NBRC 16594]GBQ82104.1 hypothetical protein AA0311_2790 [Asaia bogorensis NBRC 16594]